MKPLEETRRDANAVPLRVPQRVVVVGTSGSGKTTLAGELARRWGMPHVELDALHWEPNWTEAPLDVFRQRVEAAIEAPRWVVDGNYSKLRNLVWTRAELLVWLDYSLPLVMGRLVQRTVRRCATQELLWNGNRERLRDHLCSRQSLLLWVLQTHRGRRKRFTAQLQLDEYRHLTVVRLPSPQATRDWLATAPPPVVTKEQP
jgi:adenylate kinase family enzyme